jgi:hypothetical protein
MSSVVTDFLEQLPGFFAQLGYDKDMTLRICKSNLMNDFRICRDIGVSFGILVEYLEQFTRKHEYNLPPHRNVL